MPNTFIIKETEYIDRQVWATVDPTPFSSEDYPYQALYLSGGTQYELLASTHPIYTYMSMGSRYLRIGNVNGNFAKVSAPGYPSFGGWLTPAYGEMMNVNANTFTFCEANSIVFTEEELLYTWNAKTTNAKQDAGILQKLYRI